MWTKLLEEAQEVADVVVDIDVVVDMVVPHHRHHHAQAQEVVAVEAVEMMVVAHLLETDCLEINSTSF